MKPPRAGKGPANAGVFTISSAIANSGSNLIFVLAAARVMPVEEFGIFAIAQSFLLIVQFVIAGAATDIALRTENWRLPLLAYPASRNIKRGLPPMLVIAAAAYFWVANDLVAAVVIALMAAGPICFIDYTRAHLIRGGQQKKALKIDLIFAIQQIGVASGLTIHGGPQEAETVWLLWLATSLTPLFLSPLLRTPRPSEPPADWFSWRYALESFSVTGSAQLAQLLVTPALGLKFTAGYRGAQTLFSPMNFIFGMLRLFLIPYFSERGRSSGKHVAVVLMLVVGLTAAFGIVAVLLGDTTILVALLGQSADSTKVLLLAVAANYMTQAAMFTFIYRSRALKQDGRMTISRIVQTLGQLLSAAAMYLIPDARLFVLLSALTFLAACLPLAYGKPGPESAKA